MRRFLALLLSATLVLGQDLANAVHSPYALAKYVETHNNFDWNDMANALGISGDDIYLQRCEPCTAKLIEVQDPHQVIVIVANEGARLQVVLRFSPTGRDMWNLAGSWAPYPKFDNDQSVRRLWQRPFLVNRGSGSLGTGFASTLEEWFDLSQPELKPTFSFDPGGHILFPFPDVGRMVAARVSRVASKPLEQITVQYKVDFVTDGDQLTLFHGEATGTWVRSLVGKFELDHSRSTTDEATLRDFYTASEDGPSWPEHFLKFAKSELAAIARSQDKPKRDWLTAWLKTAPDTPESRELKRLLDATTPSRL